MLETGRLIIIFILILLPGTEKMLFSQEIPDTASINNRTRSAFINSRRNPDVVIPVAIKALAESKTIGYNKGLADASLALGFAYFAKYRADSALFFNMQAYDLYREMNNPAGKARACYGLSYVFSLKSDLQESERYAALSLNFFEEAGDSRGMINAYNVLNYLARQQKDLKKASGLIRQAVEIARSVNDSLALADALNSLAIIYRDMALFSQAIDTYFEALRIWELKKDTSGMAIGYGSIGLMYFHQKNWDKSLEFNLKKLPLSLAAGDLWEAGKTYNSIAQVYNSTFRYDTALIYLRKSLQLNKKMNYPSGIADSYHDIASTLLHLSRTDSALWYITNAVEIATETRNQDFVEYYITLANVQQKKKQYKEALQNALKAYESGRKKNLPLTISDASLLLSDIYFKINRADIAYRYLKEHMQLKDSISNDEFLKQVTRLELEYDFEKKQREADYVRAKERLAAENRIRQQRMYVRGLAVLLVLGAVIALLYLRHNRLRALYSRIDLEQRLLRAQMNPHFIFNSLCAVQDFILAGKPEKANAFLTKIARLMRNILENSREEFIPLEKEIETIRLYLDVQQLRFESGFEYQINIDETIDPENYSIPPLFTQPCVENSIEHGLLPLKKRGQLNISYSLSNGIMKLEVSDNGIGREEAAEKSADARKKQSISTKLTAERLEHFRKKLKEKSISYEITDVYENEKAAGTKVVMMLPYRKQFT
jgi:tetratricopeptide (TPR) repeat protein